MVQMIRHKVEQGTYASNGNVIREGLRLLHEREVLKVLKFARMREKIEEARLRSPSQPM